MIGVFPQELPGSTCFYLLLFVGTLVIHFVFMSYVLAGTVWIVAGLWTPSHRQSVIVEVLRDWMPVMLSGAITAGVAPLLFIQILYRQQFYTANLLQFHRWMLILPVLIVLFYLLYVVKSFGQHRALPGKLSALIAFGCVLFIAWSWSGNHELSLQPPETWHALYAEPSTTGHSSGLVWLRLTLWITITFPVLCGILAWQLRGAAEPDFQPPGIARTAAVAMSGLVTSVPAAVLLTTKLPVAAREALISSDGLTWVIVAAAGCSIQFVGWVRRFRSREDTRFTRGIVAVGILMHLIGIMMCRELVRVTLLAERIDFAGHAEAVTRGGLGLFLIFCVINAVAAAWCLRLARRDSV